MKTTIKQILETRSLRTQIGAIAWCDERVVKRAYAGTIGVKASTRKNIREAAEGLGMPGPPEPKGEKVEVTDRLPTAEEKKILETIIPLGKKAIIPAGEAVKTFRQMAKQGWLERSVSIQIDKGDAKALEAYYLTAEGKKAAKS